jgi:hypothetical protein
MHWAKNGKRHPSLPSSYERLFEALGEPASVAWRLRAKENSYRGRPSQNLTEYLDWFAEIVPPEQVGALVIGHTEHDDPENGEILRELIQRAPKYTELRSLFFGDILQEECEISWIDHGDMAPLLAAFPQLTSFTVRGGSENLSLLVTEPHGLRSLAVQSGGLRPEVIRDVCGSNLPELEHLELWLGTEDYAGEEATAEDLAPVLSGTGSPHLRSLGLRNAEHADAWVALLAEAPVTGKLRVLDLSLGTLTDTGARTILDAPVFHGLERLDLHHHYLSEDMEQRLGAALTASGVEHDLSDRQEPEVDPDEESGYFYYTAVAE